jgi:hypothetical protein
MSAKLSDHPLHELLRSYLRKQKVAYEPVVARIISVNPVQITQDGECYFELTSFGKELRADPRLSRLDLNHGQVLLKILDWRFIFSKIPNDVEFYIDIEVKKYDINDFFDFKIPPKASDACINLLDTPAFKKLYEDELTRLRMTDKQRSPDVNDSPNLNSNAKADSSKLETRGDSSSNHNKSSLRKRQFGKGSETRDNSGPLLHSPQNKHEFSEPAHTKPNMSGLGVSGLNGKENMKKLREVRNTYVTNSQDSMTDQLLFGSSHHMLHGMAALCQDDTDEKYDNKEKGFLNKRNPKDLEEGSLPKFTPISEGSYHQYVPMSDKDLQDTSFGPQILDSAPQKQIKNTQKSEITFQVGRAKLESLTYEELMECLSLDVGLLKWEDLVFSKDVVQYLKNHLADFSGKP